MTYGQTPVTALAIAPDGRVISGGQTGLSAGTFQTKLSQAHDLAVSPDGQWLLVVGGAPAESGGIELHRLDDRATVHRHLALTEDVIYSAAWSPDGRLIALASLDGTCTLMRPDESEVQHVIRGHSRGVTAVQFVSSEMLATASLDHTIRVWQVQDGKLKRTLKNHTAPVIGLALRPAVEATLPMLASISRDRTVRLWQPTIGRMVRFVRLDSPPLSVAWTPNGRWLVVACRDGDVRVVDPDTVEVQHRLAGIESHAWCLAVTPDGRNIIVAGGGGEIVRLQLPVADE